MTLDITQAQQSLLEELIREGGHADECEVIDDALMALKARDRLGAALQAGLDEMDRGDGVPAIMVFQELSRRAAQV